MGETLKSRVMNYLKEDEQRSLTYRELMQVFGASRESAFYVLKSLYEAKQIHVSGAGRSGKKEIKAYSAGSGIDMPAVSGQAKLDAVSAALFRHSYKIPAQLGVM